MHLSKFIIFCIFILLSSLYAFASKVDFQAICIDGKMISLSDYMQDKIGVVLVFWTTWCPSCRKNIRRLMIEEYKFKDNRIGLLFINAGEPKVTVEHFFSKKHPSYAKIILDRNLSLVRSFYIVGVPTFIFIDKDLKFIGRSFYLPSNFIKIFKK